MVIMAAASIAGASYSAYQSSEATKETKKQARKQEEAAKKLKADEERERLQSIMRSQKRKGATGEPSTRDTILTSPLGLPGSPQTGPKTLLGA